MRRAAQRYTQSNFAGGINQYPESARPNQVIDANNVWFSAGAITKRPGYVARLDTTGSESCDEVFGVFPVEFGDSRFVVSAFADASGGFVYKTFYRQDVDNVTFIDDTTHYSGNYPLELKATAAIIPEFEKIYIAWGHVVYDIKTTDAEVASASTNTAIVGPGMLYDPEVIAQGGFPEANLIKYFNGYMWAADILGSPYTIRWSGPVLDVAYDVWPSVSFEVLSEADGSPITALATIGEHMVVFKRDSIWIMVFDGMNELGLAKFVPKKVVAGVGCVAHQSVANVNGRLLFLSEDGFYLFDGTPNLIKVSEAVDEKISTITEGRKPWATAINWKRENCYVCAVPVDGSILNNQVLVYDYGNRDENGIGSWWFWDNIPAATWYKDESEFDLETIYFVSEPGNLGDNDGGQAYELTSKKLTDAGDAISCDLTTHRFGYGDALIKCWRECRVWSNNDVASASIDIICDDATYDSLTMSFTDDLEAKWGTGIWGTDTWVGLRQRARVLRLRYTSAWMQFKIAHSAASSFTLHQLQIGFTPVGIR
jgi:hypothetical protein